MDFVEEADASALQGTGQEADGNTAIYNGQWDPALVPCGGPNSCCATDMMDFVKVAVAINDLRQSQSLSQSQSRSQSLGPWSLMDFVEEAVA
eukprot:7898511-Heterocapsa_arctica.AAC.1